MKDEVDAQVLFQMVHLWTWMLARETLPASSPKPHLRLLMRTKGLRCAVLLANNFRSHVLVTNLFFFITFHGFPFLAMDCGGVMWLYQKIIISTIDLKAHGLCWLFFLWWHKIINHLGGNGWHFKHKQSPLVAELVEIRCFSSCVHTKEIKTYIKQYRFFGGWSPLRACKESRAFPKIRKTTQQQARKSLTP